MDDRTVVEDYKIRNSIKTNITNRLDNLQWSKWHTKLVLILGIGWAFDAFEITIVTAILPIIRRYFELDSSETSLITTLWLIGAVVGSIGFGYVADRYGRKFTFIFTMLFYSAMTLVTAFSPTFNFLLAFRFLTAIGVGAEYSAINATIVEFVPSKYRGRANSAVMGFWCVGALIAHGLQTLIIKFLNDFWAWRIGFLIGSIAAFFIIFIRRFLVESPRWLLTQGQYKKAQEVTSQIEKFCNQPDNSNFYIEEILFYFNPNQSFFRKIYVLFSKYPFYIIFAAILNASQAFSDYGVSNLLSIQVLEDIDIKNSNVALFFLYGVICTIPAYIYITFVMDVIGRKILLIIHYILGIIAIACFIPAALSYNPIAAVTGIHCFYQFAYSCIMATVYTTISESFPTHLRATAIGVSVAIGRIAAAFAPRILVMIYIPESKDLVLPVVVIICFLSAGLLVSLIWAYFGIEGKSQPLENLGYRTEVANNHSIELEAIT